MRLGYARPLDWSYRIVIMGLAAWIAGAAGGCVRSRPAILYRLSTIPAENPENADGSTRPLVLRVGPVHLPEYLNRLQIVTAVSDVEFEQAEFHRWAEPLYLNFQNVVAQNLAVLLGTENVEATGPYVPPPFDRQVPIHVLRFEGTPQRTAVLSARWSVNDGAGNRSVVVPTRRFDIAISLPSGDYAALVQGMSEAAAQLSREIAAAVRDSLP